MQQIQQELNFDFKELLNDKNFCDIFFNYLKNIKKEDNLYLIFQIKKYKEIEEDEKRFNQANLILKKYFKVYF
jgi:hypothetical protein